MATYREMVYMVLDELKFISDDSLYTEEHILFLLSKMRANLIEKKYKGGRNQTFENVNEANLQEIEVPMTLTNLLPDGCAGLFLRSEEKVPEYMDVMEPKAYAVTDAISILVTFVPIERLPFAGYNKWLKNIIYIGQGGDGFLFGKSSNPQFKYLKKIRMKAVFDDCMEASELSCNADDCGKCEVIDKVFPLEASLIPVCIEMVVRELSGVKYAPRDSQNNAKDDLSDAGVSTVRPQSASQPSNE